MWVPVHGPHPINRFLQRRTNGRTFSAAFTENGLWVQRLSFHHMTSFSRRFLSRLLDVQECQRRVVWHRHTSHNHGGWTSKFLVQPSHGWPTKTPPTVTPGGPTVTPIAGAAYDFAPMLSASCSVARGAFHAPEQMATPRVCAQSD